MRGIVVRVCGVGECLKGNHFILDIAMMILLKLRRFLCAAVKILEIAKKHSPNRFCFFMRGAAKYFELR